MLDPSSDEGPPKHLQLECVGQRVKEPKFSGTAGLELTTSKLIRKLSTRAENIEDARAAVETRVDDGVFSRALNEAAPAGTPRLDRIDTPPVPGALPARQAFNTANPVCPVALDEKQAHKLVFPENFGEAKDFEEMDLRFSPPPTPPEQREISQQAHDDYIKAKLLTRYGGGVVT